MKKQDTMHDYIIIGAGPAGLQLAYYLEKENRDYIILEKGEAAGTTFIDHPKHSKLISINKVHTGYDPKDPINLRWDWHSLLTDDHSARFTTLTTDYFPDKDIFLDYLKAFSTDFHLKIAYDTTIENIQKEDDIFTITDTSGKQFCCKYLIVATGVSKAFLPEIQGIEHAAHYNDMSLDKTDFNNERVLIIGKGNSGFETADYLIDSASVIHVASPNPIKFAWKTHYVGHLRAVNNNFLDTYQLKSQNAAINAQIDSITPKNGQYNVSFHYTLADDEKEHITYDHVIACTGFQFDTDIFDENAKPDTAIMNRFPKMTSAYESTNIDNCYYAGTIMQYRDFKKKQSGFVHGFRYNIEFLSRYLENKNHGQDYPHQILDLSPEHLAHKILAEINQTSALWQQTGYLCDLITFDAQRANYYQSMPVDFVKDTFLKKDQHAILITLEFGQERIDQEPDVFAISRVHKSNYREAHLSTAIHPVINFVQGDKVISTHHVIEDFDSVWSEEEHTKPLTQYLCAIIETMKCISQKELIG